MSFLIGLFEHKSYFEAQSKWDVWTAGLLAPFAAGASVILPDGGKFSASHFWNDAVKYQATFYTAVPTIHQVEILEAHQIWT